jgi:hypothetical protein
MEDKLWIKIENGQVVPGHHPAYESNIIEAFPELNGNLSTHFAPVDLQPLPELNFGEILSGPFYEWSGDKIINTYIVTLDETITPE